MQVVLALFVLKIAGRSSGATFDENTRLHGISKGNTMARKSESGFEDGDFVVYPTHGVGRILGTEEREVAGTTLEMLVVRFEQDRMTLRVPMEKAKSLGLRTLSSKRQMEQAITTLQGKAKVRRTMWSRRATDYENKIDSGDPVSIAEVVRDLHRRENQSEQSYSERQMYQKALVLAMFGHMLPYMGLRAGLLLWDVAQAWTRTPTGR